MQFFTRVFKYVLSGGVQILWTPTTHFIPTWQEVIELSYFVLFGYIKEIYKEKLETKGQRLEDGGYTCEFSS